MTHISSTLPPQLETIRTDTVNHHYNMGKSVTWENHIIPMVPVKYVFPPGITVNNKDFNADVNTERDEYTLDPKHIQAFNDVFDDSMTVTYEDWNDKVALHCILLEMAVDATKVAFTAIKYKDTEEGRKLSAKEKRAQRKAEKVDKKKKASVKDEDQG